MRLPVILGLGAVRPGRTGSGLSEESTASKNSVREINAALIFGCALSGIYGPDGRLGEVEDDKTGKDFLEDEVQLLKMNGANGVFQAAEGSREVPRLVMRSSVWLFSVSIRTIRKERAAKSVPFGSKPSKII